LSIWGCKNGLEVTAWISLATGVKRKKKKAN